MKRRDFTLAAAALPALAAWPALAQPGKTYAELSKRVPVDTPPGQIEVIEFFSYGCVHCKNFEPMFENWVKAAPKDVKVRLVHVGFDSNFEPLQRIYYTLLAMNKVPSVHGKVFSALQDQNKPLNVPDKLFAWVGEQGLDVARFKATYQSFGVATQIRRAMQMQDLYRVEGTPALGIAGRYYTDGSMAGGFEQMIAIANTLIDKERKRG